MRFISHGDYLLPLQFSTYWTQHVYTWSYERGAANPDGIIRLPGRLIDILVFALSGNLMFGYFYLFSCLGIAFLAFFWFARSFLGVQRKGTALLGALFFACNPIFLGNLSKVGLLLAVAMLPLALTALKQGFSQKRGSYFLLAVLALNISLLHPFTFAINFVVCLCYLGYLAKRHLPFVRDHAWKFGLLVVVSLLLNAYCILPLLSLGTVDKGALSDTVSTTATDYTSLVNIANTGDIFTGLSLSKGVLKDYEFYGPATWPFYFLGVFMFYAILFALYIRVEKRAKPHERRRFVVALSIFLVLLVLATASYLHADRLITFLIHLPGGWMFRSPLKWQLYIPLVLFTALVIALKYVRNGWHLKALYTTFVLSFVLMNGYLGVQIYQRLLTPRQVTSFAALQAMPMQRQNLLFVDSSSCIAVARNSPQVASELNQVLTSKAVQVKHVQSGMLDTVNISAYAYVMGCRGAIPEQLMTQYRFAHRHSFQGGAYELYANTEPSAYVAASGSLFSLEADTPVSGKYDFVSNTLKQPFAMTTDTAHPVPASSVQDIFDTLSPNTITRGKITGTIPASHTSGRQLFLPTDQPIYYAISEGQVSLSPRALPGMQPAPASSITLPEKTRLTVTYQDDGFTSTNLIPNPSLEKGLWQKEVGDCNAYDKKPALTMRHISGQATDGRQALELSAESHIACTGPEPVPVTEGTHYLLSFDYQTNGERYAGYYAGFDNLDETASGARLSDTQGKWQPFSTTIIAPAGAEHLRLLAYAYPAATPGQTGMARYDNFKLIAIPAVTGHFFAANTTPSLSTPTIEATTLNPTKTVIRATGMTGPWYLTTKESYHGQWRLAAHDGEGGLTNWLRSPRLIPATHFRLNGTMNGWYMDPAKICHTSSVTCEVQSDGSYALTMVMEFAPQRWFYLGTLITVITGVLALGYVIYDIRRHHTGGRL